MSQNRSRGGRGSSSKSRGGKSRSGKGGGGKKQNRSGKQKQNRSGKQKRGRKKSTVDPDRDFWANDAAEARVRSEIGRVRPAPDPAALVRSLGPPPLGKFADHAQHYYAAVYETAQRFAVAVAAANGVLETEDDETLVDEDLVDETLSAVVEEPS